jgi:hypothetical protein
MADSIIDFIIYTLGIMFLIAFGVISAIVLWKMIKQELSEDYSEDSKSSNDRRITKR